MGTEKTPLEKYIIDAYKQRGKENKTWAELEKFGKKLPSGGHVWTGGDLIRYFEARKTRKKRKKRKRR